MQLQDKVVVVTGGAHGIGRALVRRFHAEGARTVIVADLDGEGAEQVAAEVGGVGVGVDVSDDAQLVALIDDTEARFGPIDLFCSNAGILVIGGVEVADADWHQILDVNLMAHLHAARHLVPRMVERGEGYLLNTVSAAGLLTQIGSAPYAVTKHAALALAEWLSITYGDRGLKVSVLCPQAVNTAMIGGIEDGGPAGVDGVIEPDDVAAAAVVGLADERFLILPHPEVGDYVRRKADDNERWLAGMRRLQSRFLPEG